MSQRPALVRIFASLLASVLLLASAGAGLTQTLPPQPGAASAVPAPYTMTMGDMMNTLVQPRHAKLGLAGQAQNWPLAAYALAEIRQAFAGIVKAQPQFDGLPVADLVKAAVSGPLDAVAAAIKAQDVQQFRAAFDQLTQGCNACHAAVDHPFVVIKTPDASAFPNQDFDVRR
jgi:hypothetical protein